MAQRHTLVGIAFMVGATIMFALGQAITKWQVVSYPVGELVFVCMLVSLLTCAVMILPGRGLAVFRTSRLGAHALRSVVQGVALACLVLALALMPIASVIAINFSAPLFATVVAALVFREPAGRRRWMALVIGFGGVLIVTRPGADALGLGSLFAVGNAVLYGGVTAAVRSMARTESAATLTMWQMTLLTVLFAMALPFGFVLPGPADAALMLLNGMSNALGQYWWTRALTLAPAGAVGPFYYLSLVWAILIGLVIWGDVPTPHLLLGSAVVVGSGLWLLWHETKRP